MKTKQTRFLWVFAALGLAALAYQFGPRLFFRQFGYLWLDRVESRLIPGQLEEIREKTKELKAKIVWSSSRTGSHELFIMTLPDAAIFQLTHNNYVDIFPRFSPDGEKIVFIRSQRPWVSGRDLDPWDLYLLSLTTGKERLLAKEGNMPQWVDNHRISFVRKNRLLIKDLETGQETLVLDGHLPPVSGQITTPEFSPDQSGRLALTVRGKLAGVFVMDLKSKNVLKFGEGCQITWFPNGREVCWVENGGRGGNQILMSPATRPEKSVLIDLPGEHSHEYFPRLSRDGKWLIWGASAGGHELDVEDYELFLWQLGRPAAEAIRLTHNKANDSWPDIFIKPTP